MEKWQIGLLIGLGGGGLAMLYEINRQLTEAVRLLRLVANAVVKPERYTHPSGDPGRRA